jgi:hypothetical protein
MLEAAAAEDSDEVAIRMVTDEDGPDDSDYNSIDAERDTLEDDDDEGKPNPKPKVSPSYEWSHFFGGCIIRVGSIAKTSSIETQDTTNKNTQASTEHPSLSGSNGSPQGLDPTMQGITRQRGRDSDGKRNARTPRKLSTNRLTSAWTHDSVISKHG